MALSLNIILAAKSLYSSSERTSLQNAQQTFCLGLLHAATILGIYNF